MRRKEKQADALFEGSDPIKARRRTRYTQKKSRKQPEGRKPWKQQRGERFRADYDNWGDGE